MTNTRHRSWSAGALPRKPVRKKKELLSPGERRRFRQLLACLLLFGVVFLGRAAPAGRLHSLTQSLGALVHSNTDFRAVFTQMGQAVVEGEALETFGGIVSGLFQQDALAPIGGGENGDALIPPTQELPAGEGAAQDEPASEEVPNTPLAEVLPTKAVVATDEPTGIVEGETVTPVMGVLTSAFGYRTHPIDQEWKQHAGIDIMATEGTAIRAFSDGVVDYVGQSPAYGNYFQLKHSRGVTTFYAHCSAVLVKAGQRVKVGEEVARVGATGNVTGAHLHLEMKQNGTRIDPAQYVQTLSP